MVAVRGKKPAVAEAADVVYQPGDVEEGMVNPDVTKARIALEERQMMMEENLKMREIQMREVQWKREVELKQRELELKKREFELTRVTREREQAHRDSMGAKLKL